MYYPVNNFSNCTIFNKSLYQDLESYDLQLDTDMNLQLKYQNDTTPKDVSLNLDAILSYISSTDYTEDLWQPCFIDSSTNTYSQYHHILNKTINTNPIYGISNVLSFEPKFKNWEIINSSQTDYKMNCDWYINSILGCEKLNYGVMFWFKYTSYGYKKNIKFEDLLDGTKFVLDNDLTFGNITITKNSVMVKLDNNNIKLLNKKQFKIITSTNITDKTNTIEFNTEQYTIKIADIQDKTVLDSCKLYKDDALVKNNRNIEIYISNGDCFSYFYGIADELKNKNYSMSSRTYLSPVLSKIYREIYHRLTLRKNKSFTPSMSSYSSRMFQKLCYYLSTGPLMDRTTIDLLNDQSLHEAVQQYISQPYTSDINTEKTKLIDILTIIYNKYIPLSVSLYDQTLLYNHIHTKKDLFRSLINKYGLSLQISGKATLKYKHHLVNGPHAFISTVYQNYRPKTTSASAISYNNNSIKIGNILYNTNISDTGSTISVKADNFTANGAIDIPLADISITKTKPPSFYIGGPQHIIGTGISETTNTNEMVFRFSNNDGNTDQGAVYYWEHDGGPNCLRFDDANKNRFNTKRYFSSSADSPSIYVRQTGEYRIKCTRSNYGRAESDVLLLSFGPNQSSFSDIDSSTLEPPVDYPKIITSNIKSIAFNKRGLVWIVDSEHYVDTGEFQAQDDVGLPGIIKLKDIKIDLNQKEPVLVMPSGGDLELTLDNTNGNCVTSLYSIGLQNMRDNKYEYCQCKSFYQEKIKRKRISTNVNVPELGSSSFFRDSVNKTFVYNYHNIDGKTGDRVELVTPNASTYFAPPILPYGGYGKYIVDTIGIKISGHPEPQGGFIPLPTGTGYISNQIPLIKDRSSPLLLDENNPIVCHLKEIQPTGSKHYTTFNKGHFHPISGWLTNQSLQGKSNVVLNKPELKNSYKFNGIGFASIKSLSDINATIYQSSISLEPYPAYANVDQNDRYGFRNINTNTTYNPNYFIDETLDKWLASYSCCESETIYGLDNITANKNITTIEVKLDFLNHLNPKNLSIWLDVSNTISPISGVASNGSGMLLDSKNTVPSIFAPYTSNLQSANSGLSSYRIYLLNQQHISNYNDNFSITFTDSANKYTSLDRLDYSSTPLYSKTLNNNQEIQPTLSAVSGFNDIDIVTNISAIKNNQLNLINNYLIKFSGIPLTNTKFTLNIANIEPMDHDGSVRDNLISNSAMRLSFDNYNYSNILLDNICKWSVIVHTAEMRDSVDSDVLGYIDYKNSVSDLIPSGYFIDTTTNTTNNSSNYNGSYTPVNPSGYDFIGDFSQNNFLIPLVNINAPYNYLANTTQCFYNDDNIPKFISSLPPQFPSLLPYALAGIGGAMILAAAGLGGLSTAMLITSQTISAGGRSDPIINFFIDTRNYNLSVINDSQFYKPIYRGESYGYGDRAIIAISKDGAIWYNIEVPIFRYSNTPVIHKNTYKYIKLNQYAPEVLSKFNIKPIRDISDLDLINVVGSVSKDISIKIGLYNLEGINLKDNNIILLTNQTSTTNNGYWIVGTGNWVKIPSQDSINFLSYNTIGSNTSASLADPSTMNKNVLLDGIRAYNFFDIGETVEFVSPSGAQATIEDKSIILTNSGQKTILTLSSGISSTAQIFKPSGTAADNVIFLYKDASSSSIGDGSYIPFNMWSSESKSSYNIKAQTPSYRISTIADGSIGWGTDSIFPSFINQINLLDNSHMHIDDIFNNTFNDMYKLNKLNIIGHDSATLNISTTASDPASKKIKASSYSYDSIGLSLNINSLDEEDPILKQLNQTYQQDNKNKIILDLKSDKFKDIPSSGYISLEGDILFHKKIGFNTGDMAKLLARNLSLISNTNNFDPATVTDIYSISSIPDFIKYYESLSDDPIECYQINKPASLICKKNLAYKRLNELYKEQKEINKAVELSNTSDGLPHISGIVIDNLPTGLNINYKENKDLYWIHIDPNQQYLLNDELTVKVLTNSKFFAYPIIEQLVPTNIITPGFTVLSKFASSGIDIGVTPKNNSEYNYTVPSNVINDNKNKILRDYPSLIWNSNEVFQYGTLAGDNVGNSKKIMVNADGSTDYIVSLEETYIRPAGLNRFGKLSDVIDFTNTDTDSIRVKFRNFTRKLKSIDSERFVRYTYDYNGNLVRDLKPPSSVGQLANNFVCWQCFNTSGLYIADIPPFLVASNEMRYRAFFGSIDGIEHKNTFVSDSQEDWEWIPFEYFTPPPDYTPPPPVAPAPRYFKYFPNNDVRSEPYCAEPNEAYDYHDQNTPQAGPFSSLGECNSHQFGG